MDFGGHDSLFHSNVVVATQGQNCVGSAAFITGHATQIFDNDCIVYNTERVDDLFESELPFLLALRAHRPLNYPPPPLPPFFLSQIATTTSPRKAWKPSAGTTTASTRSLRMRVPRATAAASAPLACCRVGWRTTLLHRCCPLVTPSSLGAAQSCCCEEVGSGWKKTGKPCLSHMFWERG